MSSAADLVALSIASSAADGGGASSTAVDLPETLDFPSPFWPSPPDATSLDYFVSVFCPLRPDFPDSDSDFDDPVNPFTDRHTPPPPVADYLGLAGLVGSGFDTGSEDSGLRIVEFDADSDTDDELIPAPVASGGVGGRGCGSTAPDHDVCWDCFRIDNPMPDMTEDFEWEEVDGRLDDRALLSMMVGEGGEETDELSVTYPDPDHGIGRSNVEWEVLLAGDNLSVSMGHFMDPVEAEEDADLYYRDDFEFDASEYEIMFGQLPESSLRGSPPAAKSVVAGLKSIVLTEDDVAKNNTVCAVCKDEISLKEAVKQLPCLHHYHGDCIMPWLGMRNTCPVCRYELPTEDPDYEISRARRAGGAGAAVSRQPSLRRQRRIQVATTTSDIRGDGYKCVVCGSRRLEWRKCSTTGLAAPASVGGICFIGGGRWRMWRQLCAATSTWVPAEQLGGGSGELMRPSR